MSRLIRNLRRWPIIVGIVVVVVGGSGAAWALSRSSGSGNGSSQLVAAKITTVTQTVSASGTIDPLHEADLDFAVSGRVTHVRVKEGDAVKKGQVLATVGRTSLKASEAAAAATVSSDEDKVSEDSSGTQLTADEAALKAAKASLHTAKQSLDDAKLRATINGTVTSLDLTVGQQVSGSGSGSGSSSGDSDSSEVEIQSAKSFIVDATVDDTEITEVKKGQAVEVTPQGATFPVAGTVSSVSSVPSSESGVVSFPITVKLTGHPSGVYAGASATMTITTKKVANVLEIPTLAISYSGSTASVEVNSGGSTHKRTITVGDSYGLETQVLSGLKSGEKVVVRVPTFARITNGGGSGGEGFTRSFGNGGGFTGGEGGFPSGGFGGSTGTKQGGFGNGAPFSTGGAG